MPMFRRTSAPYSSVSFMKLMPLAAAVTTLLLTSGVHAATFGHARILSKAGQALAIDVPVSSLTEQDLATLTLAPAPVTDWSQAGLTPPVDLGSLSLKLTEGILPGKYILTVRSSQAFSDSVADLLLDVGTASGQQRYQVSLLAQSVKTATAATAGTSFSTAGSATNATRSSASTALKASITVKRGDTLFSIARRNAVADVTVYQMMVALQNENPNAFIHGNMNLLRAGAELSMPDASALIALTDKQARRVFQQHADAFAKYRQGKASDPSLAVAATDANAPSGGSVVRTDPASSESAAVAATDQLRLSGAAGGRSVAAASAAGAGAGAQTVAADGTAVLPSNSAGNLQDDDRVATTKGIADAESRVSQLEENVKNLSRAFQSQGEAATGLVVEGAKGLGQSLSEIANTVVQATGNTAGTDGVSKATANSGSGVASVGSTPAGTTPAGTTPAGTTSADTPTTGAGLASSSTLASPPTAGASSTAGALANGKSEPTAPAAGTSAQQENTITSSDKQKAASTVSWLQENLMAIIGGGLALIVLLIVWVLRRASSGKQAAHAISPAMVQQKLDEINLDLSQPESNSSPTKSV